MPQSALPRAGAGLCPRKWSLGCLAGESPAARSGSAFPSPHSGPAAPTCPAGLAFWLLHSHRHREWLALLPGHKHLFSTRLLCTPHRTAVLHSSAACLSRTAGSDVIMADSCQGQVTPSMSSQGVPRRDRPCGFAPSPRLEYPALGAPLDALLKMSVPLHSCSRPGHGQAVCFWWGL